MIRRHTISFTAAAEGLWYAARTQPNFVVHIFISVGVIGAGWWLGLASWEWAMITLTITGGLVIELINTAIESVVDLATSQIDPLAKMAKDCASAAMLIYALGAMIVGGLIFIPKLWPYF